MAKDFAEGKESLWSLALAPTVWAAHFMLCYLTAAIYCAKFGRDSSLFTVRLTIAAYTLVALALLGVMAVRGYRRNRRADAPESLDSPAGRHGFLGYMELLLGVLSIVAVIYSALPAVFIETCR